MKVIFINKSNEDVRYRRIEFIKWLRSDNVTLTMEGYRTQCMQYTYAFETKAELYRYFIKEYIK